MAQKAVCSEFRRMMLSLNILVQDIPGEGELRKTAKLLTEDDVILIVSKSGESSVLDASKDDDHGALRVGNQVTRHNLFPQRPFSSLSVV